MILHFKMSKRKWRACALSSLFLICSVFAAMPVQGQGIILPGVGAVNRSMGSASVAAPIDAAGAIHWNPASISGLRSSEFAFSAELFYPRTEVSSAAQADALGPGAPPVDLSGSTLSNSGVSLLPTTALVSKSDCSCWTFGLGLFTVGGFGVNYKASTNNPILTPQPPNGVGAGNVFSNLSVFQLAPTAAYQLTEAISVGIAPTVTVADLRVDPGIFASPDNANNDLFPTYPVATHSRLHWGFGLQAGIYVKTASCWDFGASIKSPQWFEKFQFNSADELGNPRLLELDVDYPMIVSIGTAYRGIPGWLFALDVRYADYKNADLFGDPAGFDPSLAVTGIGWDSAIAIGTGVQFQCSPCMSMRLGYMFTENPVPNESTFFNVASSAIAQHTIACGVSCRISQNFTTSITYAHAFENSIDGPFQSPLGAVPGTSINIDQEIDTLLFGMQANF